MVVLRNNVSKPRGGKFLLGLECYKKYSNERLRHLKSDKVQYGNEIIYMTVVVLFWCRRSIATGSSAVTVGYVDLLDVGSTAHFMNERNC